MGAKRSLMPLGIIACGAARPLTGAWLGFMISFRGTLRTISLATVAATLLNGGGQEEEEYLERELTRPRGMQHSKSACVGHTLLDIPT